MTHLTVNIKKKYRLKQFCTIFAFFIIFAVVITSLAVTGCVLLVLIVILLGVLCLHKDPINSRGYQHVINQEGGEDS